MKHIPFRRKTETEDWVRWLDTYVANEHSSLISMQSSHQ